ncbi:hypothetical protein OUZ56_031951 [Daphnia magna]|uniref:Uncharacterized protein n=1 Tax=Daphnia magna TaxID=35525 RepID=A0ABQ9ZVQ5_9CRUS|nr:hypothetical protein OUZ56_031951 [Daphnia magna]
MDVQCLAFVFVDVVHANITVKHAYALSSYVLAHALMANILLAGYVIALNNETSHELARLTCPPFTLAR